MSTDGFHEATFDGVPESVPAVRRFIRQAMGPAALPVVVVDDAELAGSEMATNAIDHTASGQPGGEFTARIALTYKDVRIEVVDQGSASTPTVQDQDVNQALAKERGRGLFLVRALGQLGSAETPSGHRVWVELPREGGDA